MVTKVKAGDDNEARFARVHALLEQITIREDNTVTAPAEVWRDAVAMSVSLGYRPRSGCNVCRLKVVDTLRTSVGLGLARRPASVSVREERMAICATCPVYHEGTKSCGRLIVDAVNPDPVEVDGRLVKPCGCFIPLKAAFRSEHCPGNFWTR